MLNFSATLKVALPLLLGAALLPSIGCNNDPMYGRSENAARTHLQFGNWDLEQRTRVDPIQAKQDSFGLMHITVNIRNTSDADLYVDAFVTYLRNGQVVEKTGPKTVTLRNNFPDTILFNSTQPADDFFVNIDYAK